MIEFPSEGLFFFSEAYWRKCCLAIWRLYWALILNKKPSLEDLVVVSCLYFNSDNVTSATQKLLSLLKKDWQYEEKDFSGQKPPFKFPIVEPNTARYLRFAAQDLIDLYLEDNLPSVCLAHHKVHWAGCPQCSPNP